jgi:hypothetical protein
MGQIKKHPPVKLVMGLIYCQEDCLGRALCLLRQAFGAVDFESETLSFAHTDYYQEEFGQNLKRKFIAFAKSISAEQLVAIKIKTNHLEEKLAQGGRRCINIDPGYLGLSKFVLATTKDYCHRVYLGQGIYAEVTLFYRQRSFQPGEWTYVDYRSPEYIKIFNCIRQIYKEQSGKKG